MVRLALLLLSPLVFAGSFGADAGLACEQDRVSPLPLTGTDKGWGSACASRSHVALAAVAEGSEAEKHTATPTAAPSPQGGGETRPILERVVMLSRHGVRAPTRAVAVLDAMTHRGWPAWPVPPGEMTEHGAKNLGFMGNFLRTTYAEKGLLPKSGCPAAGTIEVWADSLDHRTRQSGDVLAERLAPGCQVASRFAPGSALDPVFDASKSGACPYKPVALGAVLAGVARGTDGLLQPDDTRPLETLQGILAPDACKADGSGLCLIPPPDASTARRAGLLAIGATMAEGFYLEYVQGFPPRDVGWGKAANATTIATVMPVHEHGIDLLRRTPALAGHRGVVLMRTILALLSQKPLPASAPPLSPDAKLIMLAGHDSNLLYAAALAGLDWRFAGQPTMTPPDGTLAFEAWRDPATGTRTIKVVAYAQTMAQLREETPLDNARPEAVAIVPQACAATPVECEIDGWSARVQARLKGLCKG